ncbi:MAG: HTH-type transcriptional regulator CysB [Pseudomonadota bacterium]|nr:HTH-type transcriptional regulator CysB [Pseudomonadota bacterium]
MKLQQLRYVTTVARQGMNVSDAAVILNTSQPGVSKQISMLEDELNVDIFVRSGKRLTGLTEPGQLICRIAERILREAQNVKRVAEEFTQESNGSLVIATTHTQARYALPKIVQAFREQYPNVRLGLHQGNPVQIAEQVASGDADIAIATEAMEGFDELVMLPCYSWNRSVIAPPGHPILEGRLTLERVACYPIVTYDFAFTGRTLMNKAFEAQGLIPNVVLTAIDSDVIKTYVELGLGIGLVASMAFDPLRDKGLREVDASHLFEPSTTHITLRRGAYLRGFAFFFIELFAPHLTRVEVEKAIGING